MTSLVTERLLRDVAAAAADVDANRTPATQHLTQLAELDLLDLGVAELLEDDPRATDVRPAADLIAALAEECVPTAFALWAHRMTEDYLARGHRSERGEQVLADLRSGRRIGATAMAAAMKQLAGIGDLNITATRVKGGWQLNGFIAWVSNLIDGSVLVLPARTDDGGSLVAWVPLATEGVSPRHIQGLLALDATASGTVKITDAIIADDQVLTRDLVGFCRSFRPTFLVLQSAFCAGLIRRSLAEAEEALDRGENAVFGADAVTLREEVDAFLEDWQRLAADTSAASMRELLELRLKASHLAGRATRLEATLAGGRGYQVGTAANRRFREAAFLPVQSPSEGHLRWELQSLD